MLQSDMDKGTLQDINGDRIKSFFVLLWQEHGTLMLRNGHIFNLNAIENKNMVYTLDEDGSSSTKAISFTEGRQSVPRRWYVRGESGAVFCVAAVTVTATRNEIIKLNEGLKSDWRSAQQVEYWIKGLIDPTFCDNVEVVFKQLEQKLHR